jgi:hypothetical protein
VGSAVSLILALLASPATPYADPDGAFSIELPPGWTVRRESVGDGATITEVFNKSDEEGAHIDIFAQRFEETLDASQQNAVNRAVLDSFAQVVSAEYTVTKRAESKTTFDGREAIKLELDFKDEDGQAWRGYILTVCGNKFALAVMPHAPTKDPATLKLVFDHAATLRVESRTPGKPTGPAGLSGPLSTADLKSIAGRVKDNFRREPMEKVLVAGDPPLTYGSVANFVTVIELLFDVQLTEAEFDASRARFIEYYEKADAEGRRILAQQGASLLQTLTQGTPQEIAQSKAEGKAVFTNAFERGAQMGIGYAQVMWDAIQRRSKTLGQAKAAAPKDEWDNQITEGDLDATMEMLYFMWVAAGRDASDVTMDDIVKIRTQIVQELPTMNSQIQLLIANAPKVYAGLRQQWQAASPAQRMALAQQFSAALDEWGIGAQSSFQSSGGGGGGGEYSMNAQIAQNTAWNAAKTWSTTSN